MKQEIQATQKSGSLAKTSTEQSNLFSLVRSKEELEIVKTFAGIKTIAELTRDEQSNIFDLVGFWMANLGIMNTISTLEIKFIFDFIIENYSMLTIDEIKKAINLSVTKRLDCEVELYGKSFSTSYVARILESYIEYRNDTLREYQYRLKQAEANKADAPKTAAEKMKIFIDSLTSFYIEFVNDNNRVSYLYMFYDFLKRTKRLKATKESIEAAKAYGEKCTDEEVKNLYTNEIGDLIRDFQNVNLDIVREKHAKNYLVAEFLKTLDFQKFVSEITEKEF